MIEVTGLTKIYNEGDQPVCVFENLSLTLPDGQFLALMGSSGAGKTTLLQLLGCLDNPTSGTYRLAGQDVARLPEDDLAEIRNQKIGFVFQSSYFIEYLDLLENVALPGFYAGKLNSSQSRNRATQLLNDVGLAHRAHHLPSMLSGGERQRAAIARALFNRPKLLLADEPTGNLDAKNTELIMTSLAQLNAAGMPIILVTHDSSIAAKAQRVLELREGKLLERSHATH